MEKFRTLFMGTPEFAVPTLKFLAAHHAVVGVVTQPDKPRGRGQKLLPSAVKEAASRLKIPVYQPPKVKAAEFLDVLRGLKPELIVVVAFGQILPPEILSLPPYGCINVHASLLPDYRGAAPMQWCLIEGETKTGVTTMYMDEGLDTGDMLVKKEISLPPDMTFGELHDELKELGVAALKETLEKLAASTLRRTAQPAESSYAPLITKETGHIDWQKSAGAIHNLVRGLNPAPGAYTYLGEAKYKIWRAEVLNEKGAGQPGEIVTADGQNGLKVATGDGLLRIKEWQAPGGKKMTVPDYLRGHAITLPASFGCVSKTKRRSGCGEETCRKEET